MKTRIQLRSSPRGTNNREALGAGRRLFSAVTPTNIPDAVYKQIVALITRGHLRPGQRLPSERKMSQELGVSRQSIREAMSTAKAAGLIEVRQGEGAFVISSVKDNIGAPLSLLLAEQAEKVFEFLEIRKHIEVWCAEKAAQNANAADLRQLDRILQRMRKAITNQALMEKADYQFHSAIAGASHNVVAMHVMEGLKESFDRYFRIKKFTTRPERKDVLLQQHLNIYEAIRAKDVKGARQAILAHLDYVEEMISEDLLKKRPGKKR